MYLYVYIYVCYSHPHILPDALHCTTMSTVYIYITSHGYMCAFVFHIKQKRPSTVIQKNTPTINKMLMSVKHLVKVIPIKLPHGLPSDESDFHHCVLHDDGTLEIKRVLHPVEKSLTDSSQEREGGIWAMQDSTVERACMRVLQTFSLSREYFPAKYIYKYNQDGKEHRYTGDHNIGANRDWY